MSNERMEQWLKEDSKFIKLKVGEKYESLYKGMKFDETGGFKGKPTVKYLLQDLSDGKERELSSSSKSFATKMSKMREGDRIIISAFLNDRETKTYEVVRIQGAPPQAEQQINGGEIDPKLIPF